MHTHLVRKKRKKECGWRAEGRMCRNCIYVITSGDNSTYPRFCTLHSFPTKAYASCEDWGDPHTLDPKEVTWTPEQVEKFLTIPAPRVQELIDFKVIDDLVKPIKFKEINAEGTDTRWEIDVAGDLED